MGERTELGGYILTEGERGAFKAMSKREAQVVALGLFRLSQHADCPQWVRDTASVIAGVEHVDSSPIHR